MSLTSDDLLKKLKPTKTFAPTADDIRRLARLAIELGPDAFSKRWETNVAPKNRRRTNNTSSAAVASAKTKAARFGAKRKLTSAQTAQAIYSYFKAEKDIGVAPPKTASKSTAAMIDWLVRKASEGVVLRGLNAFFSKYESATDLTHRLPKPAN